MSGPSLNTKELLVIHNRPCEHSSKLQLSIRFTPIHCLDVRQDWYPMYYPEGMKARVSPVQSIEPHRILAPHSGLEPGTSGYTVQSSNHCTPFTSVTFSCRWHNLFIIYRYLGQFHIFPNIKRNFHSCFSQHHFRLNRSTSVTSDIPLGSQNASKFDSADPNHHPRVHRTALLRT